MKKIDSCPICGTKKFKPFLEVKDYSTTKEEFIICKCTDCDFLFTNPIPEEKEIGKYYDNPNYISHTNSSKGLFGTVYQAIRNKALKHKLAWISTYKKTGVLIDYGSGTGEFLKYCVDHGWLGKGFELSDKARSMAVTNYGLDIKHPTDFNSLENDSVDVITMWHVLEHLPDLQEVLTKLTSKIRHGGLLALALPNPESWDASHYGKYWAAWDVPIHFYHFKKQDISRIAKQHGLIVREIIKMPYDSYYVSLLSEEYKNGKKNWISALYNGLLSNLKAGEENSSSLTYILEKT
jgi:SAM-dependent methyltransferase